MLLYINLTYSKVQFGLRFAKPKVSFFSHWREIQIRGITFRESSWHSKPELFTVKTRIYTKVPTAGSLVSYAILNSLTLFYNVLPCRKTKFNDPPLQKTVCWGIKSLNVANVSIRAQFFINSQVFKFLVWPLMVVTLDFICR